ncbi:MAG: hypothetical protein ACRYFS_06865 [Janthinobacterium lividum]
MEFDKCRRKSPQQKKQEDYDRKRISIPEYPHLHRRNYPRVKKRFKRMERRIGQAIINLALLKGCADEVSDAMLKTVSVRLKGPKQGASTLREIVERKLDRRVQMHGARKRRHGLLYAPMSLPKSTN